MRRTSFLLPCLLLAGCAELAALNDLRDAYESGEFGIGSLLGVVPTSNFGQTGHIAMSLGHALGPDALVEVQRENGQWERCEKVGGEDRPGAAVNAFTVLVDGSGSMELTYVNGECDTCPHDPGRERVGAARRFVWTVADVAPRSSLLVGEFGPPPHPDFRATRILSDYGESFEYAEQAVDALMGYEPIGTPLWDSVGEMVLETERERDRLIEVNQGERVGSAIVILSDGEDNASSYFDLQTASNEAVAAGIPVFAIGLGPASVSVYDPDEYGFSQTNSVLDLQKIAQRTGGFYSSVAEPGRLHDLFDTVATSLAEGYTVETYSCFDHEAHVPSGQLVMGRVNTGTLELPWMFLAP